MHIAYKAQLTCDLTGEYQWYQGASLTGTAGWSLLWSMTRYTPLSSCRHSCSTTVSLGADRAVSQLRG